jgi:hypothetical protein
LRIEACLRFVVIRVACAVVNDSALRKEIRRTNPDLKMIVVSGYAEEAFQKILAIRISAQAVHAQAARRHRATNAPPRDCCTPQGSGVRLANSIQFQNRFN